jgi:hypothetical protein
MVFLVFNPGHSALLLSYPVPCALYFLLSTISFSFLSLPFFLVTIVLYVAFREV